MIDRATVDKIMDAANIVDVVSDFVTLKRAGANLKGLCPFHDDRTPSFIVSPAKNYCKCFACGKGGSPVGFIMEHEQISYPEALRYLAKKYGITIEEKEMSQEDVQRQDDRESMFIVNEWANTWFQRQLNETVDGKAIGLAYFRQRGFRDDIIKKFQLGFCPNSREVSMSDDAIKAGYQERYLTNDPETGIGTGLSIKNDKGKLRDRYWGRVIFPIFTLSGKVVGFGGRVLDAATKGVNVKYQNSPESIIYSKKRELYGLFQAKQAIRKYDLCYLVEGYTDVMAMHQSGMENVVASSGTALTDDQIRLIHRLTENITVVYDGDAAGIKASQRGIDMLLSQGMNVRLLLLPDGDDPDSFARKHNAEEYQKYFQEHQVDFIKFKTNLLLEEAQGDPIAKSKLVNNIVQSISCIPNEITRSVYVQETANAMHMQERLIASAVAKQVQQNYEEARKQQDRETAQRLRKETGNETNRGQESVSSNIDDRPPLPTNVNTVGGTQDTERPPLPDEGLSPLVASIKQRDKLRFEQKECELLRLVVRYGEQPLENTATSEEGNGAITVTQFIATSLQQDGLSFTIPLHQKMLNAALEKKEGITTERHLLNYPDPAINSLAFDLATDNEQLSRLYQSGTKVYTSTDDISLPALVQHILTDYKLEIVVQEKAQIMRELQDPNLIKDPQRYLTVMTQYKEIKDIEKKLSHTQGGRVII